MDPNCTQIVIRFIYLTGIKRLTLLIMVQKEVEKLPSIINLDNHKKGGKISSNMSACQTKNLFKIQVQFQNNLLSLFGLIKKISDQISCD